LFYSIIRKEISKEVENHMKQKRTFTFIILLLIVLGLSACSAQTTVLSGKYISTFNNEIYYTFNEENYSTNNLWKDIDITDNGNGTYIIKDEKIITYINGDDNYLFEIGYVYDKYIGSWWKGILPKTYEENTITNILGDLILTYNFKEDKTYEYTVTSNNGIVHTENGTYTINSKEVVCTSEEGVVTTFIGAEDKVFCIEYVKE